jgi:MATE family multidrug resistance protein
MIRGIAGAAIAALIAEAAGLLLGLLIARQLSKGQFAASRALLFDRTKLMRMLAVNRDIMIRTASLIAAFLFFTAQGARAGDMTLAANAVLNNFLLFGAFFLDGLANAAMQTPNLVERFRRAGFSKKSFQRGATTVSRFFELR